MRLTRSNAQEPCGGLQLVFAGLLRCVTFVLDVSGLKYAISFSLSQSCLFSTSLYRSSLFLSRSLPLAAKGPKARTLSAPELLRCAGNNETVASLFCQR